MKKRHIWMWPVLLVVVLSVGACVIGSVQQPQVVALPTASATQNSPATPSGSAVQAPDLVDSQDTLERIYEQVNPSVVNIHVTVPVQQSASPFQFFFGQQAPDQSQQEEEALGSGFVLDTEGHIVTNNHVVDSADSIIVTFQDGTTVPATVVGTDPDSDLAVVKVEGVPAERLHPVTFADSTQLKVGQLAIAIGNPFGLEGTMTVGIISALGRALPADTSDAQGSSYTIPDVIQTDAAINPGNSGGVLVDDAGRVVGVTSAIVSSAGSSAGIGFAIPSIIVEKEAPKLIADGHYDHPRLGISGTSLNSELAEAMNLNADQRGVLVVEIQPNGPADKAGLRGSDREVTIEGQQALVGGDVIIGINDQPVASFDDLTTYLARYTDVGQTIKLTVLRDGKSETIDITLDARTTSQTASNTDNTDGTSVYLGIQGLDLTSEIAQAMGLDPSQQGVLVDKIVQGSPADEAGLRGDYKSAEIDGQAVQIGGDVIVAVDDQIVDSYRTLLDILSQHQPGDEITLTVLRNGEEIQVDVTLAEPPTA